MIRGKLQRNFRKKLKRNFAKYYLYLWVPSHIFAATNGKICPTWAQLTFYIKSFCFQYDSCKINTKCCKVHGDLALIYDDNKIVTSWQLRTIICVQECSKWALWAPTQAISKLHLSCECLSHLHKATFDVVSCLSDKKMKLSIHELLNE